MIVSALCVQKCNLWFLLVPLVPSHSTASIQVLRDLCLSHILLHLHRADSRVTKVSMCIWLSTGMLTRCAVPLAHLHLRVWDVNFQIEQLCNMSHDTAVVDRVKLWICEVTWPPCAVFSYRNIEFSKWTWKPYRVLKKWVGPTDFSFGITLMPSVRSMANKLCPERAKSLDIVSNKQITLLYIERTNPPLGTRCPPIRSDFTFFSRKASLCYRVRLL